MAFLMVNANATTTRQKLDGIRQKPRKFVCINDDIDHSDPRSITTLRVIRVCLISTTKFHLTMAISHTQEILSVDASSAIVV